MTTEMWTTNQRKQRRKSCVWGGTGNMTSVRIKEEAVKAKVPTSAEEGPERPLTLKFAPVAKAIVDQPEAEP
eukprot:6965769-Karenia_brevis.AAC.1